MKIMVLLFLPIVASSNPMHTKQACPDAIKIHDSFIGKVDSLIFSDPGNWLCEVIWTERNGRPMAFKDYAKNRLSFIAELHALEKKDDAGRISITEAKRIRKLMLLLMGLSKDTP